MTSLNYSIKQKGRNNGFDTNTNKTAQELISSAKQVSAVIALLDEAEYGAFYCEVPERNDR
nr:hypothetical protein [Candidatus Kuenenia stuttgartiensis]